ncbi:DNA ligase [Luteimonas arsenica]|uniref:DNA ligase n=1 Tax=Luteimonas arsenica TaxID=1586242 RepID=UPI001FB5C8C5|nr:DNA ligase [Luteimonas arsenica]
MTRRPAIAAGVLRRSTLACACASALAFLSSAACAQPAGLMHAAPMAVDAVGVPHPIEEYWISEKLDGVRGRWDGRRLWTRGGLPVDAPAWFTAGWPALPMDGELWMGRGRFEATSSMVRNPPADDAAWRGMRFVVFDLPAHGGRFGERVEAMRALAGPDASPWLRPVAQSRVSDHAQLHARLTAVFAVGGEGLMLHHRDAHYFAGRNPGLLKLKPHDDAEARVVAHIPGRGKYAGQVGALLVERDDGARFRLGSGLSDADRAAPPPPGSLVTYRYNGLTVNGLPRFPRYLRLRESASDQQPLAVRLGEPTQQACTASRCP